MHPTSSATRISITLRRSDHRVYVSAQRNLARIMGDRAPALEQLIHDQLVNRDVAGITDEYLDRVGWAKPAGREVSLRQPSPLHKKRPGFVAHKLRGRSGAGKTKSDFEEPVDPSRN